MSRRCREQHLDRLDWARFERELSNLLAVAHKRLDIRDRDRARRVEGPSYSRIPRRRDGAPLQRPPLTPTIEVPSVV